MKKLSRAALITAALLSSAGGCELIASIDRSQIPTGDGGKSGASSSSSSSSTSSSSGGGNGGMAGAGGTGGVAGAGGTGGVAGAGGTGGVGGAGGSGGSGMPCQVPGDCPATGVDCVEATCVGNVCGTAPSAAGTPVAAQTNGDCQVKQCDGTGMVTSVADDQDVPNDANACTSDVCSNGVPSNPASAAGTACGAGMTSVCDGQGACVECIVASTCPGQDTECQVRSCTNGVCGFSNTAVGTPTSMQMPGDCKENQCDGAGAIASVNKDTDVPVDSNTCTDDVCTAGVPTNPPVASGMMCGTNGLCNAMGQCVGCLVATDCPGQDTECQTRTCDAGVCGFLYTATGTATSMQTAGDCKENQCNGMGVIVSVAKNADLPVDNNQCTSDVCTAGVPSNPPVTLNTACSQNGGTFCNATGSCVQCNAATQCAGMDTECQTRTCNANTCGFSFTAAGTPTSMQTAGDCKENQCNGSGAIVSATKNSDLPVDNIQCTSDVCTAGVPSNPPVASGTTCSQNGGSVCSGMGSCVQCVVASTCPGTDTECQTRTCNANMCGFSFAAAGTPTSMQTAGDCKENQCNGSGAIVNATKNTDLPVDGNTCTSDVCTAGVPSNPPVASGTMCGTNGLCNATGQCVGCITASDCPGMDTECQTRTCVANMCGFSFAAAGTPVAMQTGGDCKENQCNGSGAIVSATNNADLPIDNVQCTDDVCTAGVPSNPPTASGTTCNQSGGSVCSGTGSCVQCVVASTCPGVDTECQTRTCNANVCGFSFAAAGTPVAMQTAGDCKTNQCNGSGAIVNVDNNTDVPVDMNDCTDDVCTAGVPSNPPSAVNAPCSQGGGSFCNGASSCVQCNAAAQCAGSDTECQTRTCTMGTCGFSFATAGTPVAMQTPGDCKENQCNGSGAIVPATKNSDLPVDGNQCTDDVCINGVPSNPSLALNTPCTQNGGSYCDGATSCVQCNTATQCAGSDTECQTRTCNANTCGVSFAAAGTPVAMQTAGDCKVNQCNGSGAIVAANNDADLPIDMNDCTDDACTMGVPSNLPSVINSPCNQGGGSYCDGASSCVQCTATAQCSGMTTECQTPACNMGTCGFSYTAAGTPVMMQTPGDCKVNQCDGAGATVTVDNNADVPVDGNQCTSDVCTMGMPLNPPVTLGTACNQNGGTACDNTPTCTLPPTVTATNPANNTTAVAGNTLSVTFSTAMNAATLTAQSTAGACSGSVQVSLDDFASCIAISGGTLAGNVYTMTAAPGLLVNRTYKIRVTTAATATTGLPLASQFDMTPGFTTTSPNLCGGGPIVISQIYGGGGNAGATYNRDFVELHNRGSVTVNLTGWSVQYASAAGTTWTPVNLSGSIAPGGYYLVGLFSGATGAALPAVDLSSMAVNMASTAGKVALIGSTTALTGACPTSPLMSDFVGYGAGANCSETAIITPGPATNTTAVLRGVNGCVDTNNNSVDLAVGPVAARNSMSAAVTCGCSGVRNESGNAFEADYCNVQAPPSLSVPAGGTSPLVYGRVFETSLTAIPGAQPNVFAQLGFGPPTANPQYESGWTWSNATFNVQTGMFNDNDEYQASFVAPGMSGSYRYVYRFSIDSGLSWTYCDIGTDTGAGSNAGLSFEFADMPVLTVP